MSNVLALKYRPSVFSEVIGQDEVIASIQKALDSGTLGHALMFSGTRGSGKTSSARILAKELNKDNPNLSGVKWEKNSSLVMTEIDAASNNGVDQIRGLTEQLAYSISGHRVLILDEAHMLSKSAFNALLKTLEEPPPNTTFILLTTEAHKIIPTIRSRCQVYEFKSVDPSVLAKYYREVASKEGLEISDEVLYSIALRAEGSVRDGLSILQKSLSGPIAKDSTGAYHTLFQAIYLADVNKSLETTDLLYKSEEPKQIIQMLEKWLYWASLELLKVDNKTPLHNHFTTEELSCLDLAHLQRLFSTSIGIERDMNYTSNTKAALDMGIIRLCL